jgi:hypothetical protein
MSYKTERVFFNKPGYRRTIERGLTLEEAQEHCSDPETSSSTCKGKEGLERTKKYGPWFDCYTEE